MDGLTRRQARQEKPGVEAATQQGRRDPAGKGDQTVVGRFEAERPEGLAKGLAFRQERAYLLAISGARESSLPAGEEDADFLEQLPNRCGGDRIRPFGVISVDRAPWKDICVRRKVGAARPPHQKQLPRLLPVHQENRGGGTRERRWSVEIELACEARRGGDATESTIRNVDLGISGKVALVTAGTRGIGLGIANALSAEGVRVAVAARTEVDVKRTAAALGGLGIVADLLTEDGCRRAVSETEQSLGPIDILVNNLGIRAGSSWSDTGLAEFEAAFAGNAGVSVRMTQLVIPGMLLRGWGRVIVISSIWGRESGGAPAYNAAKAAEISFVTAMAREVAAKGVTVNSIAPGSILWEGGGWHRRQQADPDAIAELVLREMPLGRFGTVEEVAALVTFVCSQQAGLVNGACIPVDGGQSRSNI